MKKPNPFSLLSSLNIVSFLEDLNRFLLFSALFLVPLVFCPFIGNFAFIKQTILMLLVGISLLVVFLRLFLKGKIKIYFWFLDVFILVFVVLLLLSTIFSLWQWASFWGWPQDGLDNFLNIILFVGFYFLLVQIIRKEDKEKVVIVLVFSAFFLSLWVLIRTFIFSDQALPLVFTGGVGSGAIFLALALFLSLYLALFSYGLKKIVFVVCSLIIGSGVIVINSWLGWLALLFSAVVFIVFGFGRVLKEGKIFIFLSFVFLVSGLVFGFFKIPFPGLSFPPAEIFPSYSATIESSKAILKESFKNLLLGSGPGTFRYGFNKYKPVEMNQTIFWNTDFVRGGAEIIELISSWGMIPTAIFLFICFIVLSQVFQKIFKIEKEAEFSFFLVLVCLFVCLLIMKFLYLYNFTLAWLWWILLALIGINFSRKEREIVLNKNYRLSIFFALFLILVLVTIIFCFYSQAKRVLAEIYYYRFLNSLDQQDWKKAELLINQAIAYNPYQDNFRRDLSQYYLRRAIEESQKETSVEFSQQIGFYVSLAVKEAREASEINPYNSKNWQVRGFVYRQLLQANLPDAFKEAKESYQKAILLDPNNPLLALEMSRLYLSYANIVGEKREENLKKAEEFVNKALELKPDYPPAYLHKALIFEAQNKRREAIEMLEALKQEPFILGYNPFQDVGLAFQLGVLYYYDNQLEKAQVELERAIALDSNYADPYYFLGLIYDKKGDKEKAIVQFEKVKTLNPYNRQIEKIIANLKEGKPALEDLE